MSEANGSRPTLFARGDCKADIAVIVVTYNSAADIVHLLEDLRTAALDSTLRVIVIDNESADGTAEVVQQHEDVTFVESGGNLGYAGGINIGLQFADQDESVLILNPDLRLRPGTIQQLQRVLDSDPGVGVVVPLICDVGGAVYPSLRQEPSLSRAVGDALFGRKLWRSRPGLLSEFDYRPGSYLYAHDVDWATGAALLVRADVVRRIGRWNETFFLYSEETEYFRRVRDSGYRVVFEPRAVVEHRLGGSGSSPALATLLAVNRINYVEIYHGALYSALFRAAVLLNDALRVYDPAHRYALTVVANRSRWPELPAASRSVPAALTGPRRRGAVIVPAYNESSVIERTLAPLSQAAVDGFIELIVVCNGCTDDTADRARSVPGAQVLELEVGSKTAALNAGDDTATTWPRLYLDADIEITVDAVLAVLDHLADDQVLAARPTFRYGTAGASALVRSYYRARTNMPAHRNALWWAGVYGMNRKGHLRIGTFPEVTGDDMFVDSQFDSHEKAVVATDPSVWHTPTTVEGLLKVLGRHHRGNSELVARDPNRTPKTGLTTALAVLRTVRGPRSAFDAAVYFAIAFTARRRAAGGVAGWERDDTSRISR